MQVSEVIGFKKELARYEPDENLPLPLELIGVEVELERTGNMPYPDETFWHVTNDGSLRNSGREFVFREPLYGQAIQSALMSLQRSIDEGRPVISERCSVHVHINISDLTTAQLHKMLMLYLIFERVLVKYHQSVREDNIFCVPFYKAPQYIVLMDAMMSESVENMNHMFGHFNKYYAVNLESIRAFGSLEFRHMGGCTNMPDVLTWIKIIMCLKKASLDDNYNPYNLITNISGQGPRAIFYDIFGDLASSLDYYELEGDIIKGVRLAQLSIIDKDLQKIDDSYRRYQVNDNVTVWIEESLRYTEPDNLTFTLFGPEEGDV